MDKGYTNGPTADNMKVNTLTTRKKGTEFTNIPTVAVIKDNGRMVNNMERVLSSALKEYQGKENGNKGNDFIG
jgi:hypothetical protein